MSLLNKATDEQLNELLPLLKDCHFNIELTEAPGQTAFFFACERATIAAQLLMELGAQIDCESSSGRPLYLAFL